MNINSIDFSRQANEVASDCRTRGRIVASAIALAVSQALPIPSFEVEDISAHYNTQVFEHARRYLNEINESVVFNTPDAAALTRQLWLMRYSAAFPRFEVLCAGQYGFFDTLMGVGVFVDEGSHCFLNDNKQAVFTLAHAARTMVAEVNNG